MIFGFSMVDVMVALVGVLGGVALVGAFYLHTQAQQRAEEHFETVLEESEGPVTFDPPEMRLGPLDYWRAMRHLQVQRKAAKKGYVKWFLLDSTMQRPRWVKPKPSGAGRPKHTVDGQPYYFEKDAMVPDQRSGAWVAVHIEGESDPVNLDDPAYPGIQADTMERVINLEAESKPPGLFDNLMGMDSTTLMWLAIGLMFILFAAYRYAGGGM